MRIVLSILGVLIMLGCEEKVLVPDQPKSKRPNVVLIMVDDLNDWIGATSGHPQTQTPNIDRFASSGVLFTNAYCSAPACNPSRVSILTGISPSTTGIYGNEVNFRDVALTSNAVTLPQYFNQYGYETVATGKIFHQSRGEYDEPRPLSDAISWEIERKGVNTISKPDGWWEEHKNESAIAQLFYWGISPQLTNETGDVLSAQYVADYLKTTHERPFFIACGFSKPHLPWFVPAEFYNRFNPENTILANILKDDLSDVPDAALALLQSDKQKKIVDGNLFQEATAAYLACINYADYCTGIVLNALETSKYADNTIVILMSDHGYHLGEKNTWTKFTLWERSALAPLIIRTPNGHTGVSHHIVSYLDIYPTLAALCDLPPKTNNQGTSLVPILTDPVNADWHNLAATYSSDNTYSIRNETFRYIHYADGSEELYNHNVDPNEWFNIAGNATYDDLKEEFINYYQSTK